MSKKSVATRPNFAPTNSTSVNSTLTKKTARRRALDARAIKPLEHLELRRMLAAHIVGDPSNTNYASIQTAIDNAPANATINVDAGNYVEQVVVYNGVNLRGAQAGVDARSNARGSAGAAAESIITGIVSGATTSYAFKVAGSDCTIDGFIVQGQSSPSSTTGAGIVINPNIAGTHIVNNIVQNNVTGLYLSNNSASDAALIQHNIFRNNNTTGAETGRGIYTDGSVSGGTLTNVLIDGNFFFGNLGTPDFKVQPAIGLEAGPASVQTNIQITNNVFDTNGKAVLAFNASNITISGNVIGNHWDVSSAALRFEGGDSNITITNNNIYGSGGRAIYIDEKGSPNINTGFTITGNNIYQNGLEPEGQLTGLIIDAGQYNGTLNATNNWWGTNDGPGGDFGGNGDHITRNGNAVTYQPFATAPVIERQVPWDGLAAVPGSPIQSEDFDHGLEGVSFHDTTGDNSTGSYRPNQGVDVTANNDPTFTGGYMVTATKAGEWIEYAVNIAQGGTYQFDGRVQSTSSGAAFHLEADTSTTFAGSVTIPSSASWQTVTKTGLSFSTSGTHIFRVVMDTNNSGGTVGNWNWIKLTLTAASTPAAPSNLAASSVSSTQVNVTWADNSNNETGFILERSTDNVNFTQIATPAANATSYPDTTGLGGATQYYYRIRATNANGPSLNSGVASVITLPAPWVDSDIGSVGLAGSSAYATTAGGTFTLKGAGVDIYNNADSFNFLYQPLNGDGTIIARVASLQNVSNATSAGVMIRESLAAGAPEASVVLQASTGIGFVTRSALNGSSSVVVSTGTQPYWVKLVRSGNAFTAYRSADGTTWGTAISTINITMAANVYIGLAVCSTNTAALATATFDGVQVTSVPPFAYMTGSTLNVQFDGTATPITLAASGANIIATQGATNLTFSGVVAINAIGTANSDALQLSGALTPTLSFANGNGADSVRVMSGSYTFGTDLSPSLRNVALTIDAGAAAIFNATQHLASLTVTGTATLAAGGAKVLVTKVLAVTGKLDLKDNDLVLDYTSVSPVGTWGGSTYGGVTGMIAAGRNGGAWNGNGIVTSSAASNLNTLGVAEASQVLGITGTQTSVFSGETIDATAVLIKYTYGGDANLDGKLNVDDYTKIDFNVPLGIRGFYNGDFNLDGKINVDDYTIIDFNVGIQGPIL